MPEDEMLVDPYATSVYSPVAIARIPARREREYLAFQVLGLSRYPDGTLRPGTESQKQEARTWLMLR